MVMSFSLQPHGYKVATPKASSRMGNRRNLRASLSSRRSVQWAKQGEARLPRLILTLADETIPSPGVRLCGNAPNSLGSGLASRIFSRALRDGSRGDGAVGLALHATRSILRLVLRSTNPARTDPIPRTPGVVSSDGLPADWRAFCCGTMVTLAFFLPADLGSRSKPLGAR